MQPSLNYIFNKIVDKVPDARLCDYNAWHFDFEWMSVASADTFGKNGFLYFVEPGIRVHGGDSKASYACVVCESYAAEFAGVPRIVLPNRSDMGALFDYAVGVIEQFRQWNKSVNEILLGDASLQDLLAATFALVPRPIYIADVYWRMIARVDGDMDEMSSYWLHEIRYGCLPMDTIECLSTTGEYRLVTGSNRAQLIHTKSFNLNYIAKTISYRGRPLALLFFIDTWNDLGACEIEIADKLGNLLGPALGLRNNSAFGDATHQGGLVSLLDSENMNEKQLRGALATATGWDMQGEFQLVALRIPDSDLNNPMARMRIESLLSSGFDCYIIPDGPMTFVAYRDIGGFSQDFMAYLKNCAGILSCELLVSARFRDFSYASYYYKLFRNHLNELELLRKDLGGNVVLFDAMVPALLARSCEDRFPHSYEVDLLKSYDAAHGTDFTRTLYLYLLNERNTVATAAALYLHRNSTHARLEKINALIDVDLDDPNVRMRLLIDLNAAINNTL